MTVGNQLKSQAVISIFLVFTVMLVITQLNAKSVTTFTMQTMENISLQLTRITKETRILMNEVQLNSQNKYKKNIQIVSDINYNFEEYSTKLQIDTLSASANVEEQIEADLSNYLGLLKEIKPNKYNEKEITEVLNFILTDLRLKLATGFNSEKADFLRKSVKIEVFVFDKNEQQKLPGYDVIVKPYRSISDKFLQLNPTNNARGEITPGSKLVSISKNGLSIDSRRVELYYDENNLIVPIIFIAK